MRFLVCVLLSSVSAGPLLAQSSLGIKGSDLTFGVQQDEAGAAQVETTFRFDVAVTEFHGFQGDIAFEDTDYGLIGSVGAHFHMTPREGQRYGLFASISDVDGRSMTWGSIGAEGMLSLGETSVVEGRAGMGVSDVGGLDYIFAGGSIATEFSPGIEFEANIDVAEFEEASFQAVSYDAGLTARYSPEGAPWGVYASVARSGLSGADGVPGETRLGLGLTMSFGATGGTDPRFRPFRTSDPVAQLVRRDLW